MGVLAHRSVAARLGGLLGRRQCEVTADLSWQLADIDRLLEITSESTRRQPFAAVVGHHRGERNHRDLERPRIALELPRDIRSIHVRQAEVQKNHIRPALAREGDALASARRLDRPEPGSPKHVSRETPILVVVVDDEDERRLHDGRILLAMPIRIVLAEDQYLVREGIRRLLEAQDNLEIAAVCDDLDSLLAAVATEKPNVVVTDVRMPPTNTDEGIRAATRLRETDPEVGVVVLSEYAIPSYVLALLEAGSERRAYLLKERVSDVTQLVGAINAVAEGGSVLDPKVVEALVAESARTEESPLSQLTPRERDVLREMAGGKNNAAIAGSLVLTERSVEKVIHSIFLKLGLTWEPAVHKRVKAVILYLAESP
jgi:DNA-binding NarL/FixJ family response regulator